MRPDHDLITPAALAAAAAWLYGAEYCARIVHPTARAPWLVARLERHGGNRWAPDTLFVGLDAQGYYVALDETAAGANETLTALLRERLARQRERRGEAA